MLRDAMGVGFVGYGWIARAHAHALHTINHLAPLAKRVRLVSMAGRRANRAEAVGRELGFERWTTRWEEVVEDDEVEVVAVVGPNPVHAPVSIAAAARGKAVLCEKPLGVDAAESREMLEAVEEAGVTHACGFNYRYVPALALARDLVASGRLGGLRHYRALYLQDYLAVSGEPRGPGAVGDYSHLVDMLRHLAGEPLSVSAYTARFLSESEDAFVATLELPDGAVASLEASRCATGWKGRHRVELNGTEGSLWWDMEDLNRLHVFLVADEGDRLGGFRSVLVTERDHPFLARWWTAGHIVGWEAAFVHQWRDFLEAVLEGRPVSPAQASFEDGYRAAVICDAILASAREGRCIGLNQAGAANV